VRSLEADLRALGGVVGAVERDPDVRAKPRVGPKLCTGFQPSCLGDGRERAPSDYEVLDDAKFFRWIRAAGPRPEGAEPPQALGSSMARNSDRPLRYGFAGLPKAGRQNVSEALQLLEERRRLLAFWTITLPPEALVAINRADSWPAFAEGVLRRLRRKLRARLGTALVTGVVELQPRRTKREGRPCPHLHLVFVARQWRTAGWAVQKADLDLIIKEAAFEAGVQADCSYESAGNVQPVKKSVRAYLGKYMTKGSSDAAVWQGTEWEGLIPRQWWLWTAECRQLVNDCRIQLPTGFLAWVWANRSRLLNEGRFFLQQCRVPVEAPATYRIHWNKVQNIAAVMAQWHEALEDNLWQARQQIGVWVNPSGLSYRNPRSCSSSACPSCSF